MSDPTAEGAPAGLFLALYAASSDAVVITDAKGHICWVNGACQRLLGYGPGELVGQAVEVLVPSRFTRHREHRDAYLERPHARGMATGIQLQGRHREGHDVPIDVALTPVEHEGRRWVAATMRDLRGRIDAGETLRVLATALRSAANGAVITDRGGVVTWVNPAACLMSGYGAEELVGQHTRIFKSGHHEPEFYAQLWATVLAGQTWSGTIINRRKDGTFYHEEQTIAPVVDDAGQGSCFIAIKQDVTRRHLAETALAKAREDLSVRLAEIESLNSQLRDQSIRDPLTHLFNRRYFNETIARDVSAATRKKEPISFLALDVDHFKKVNDAYGHAVGDAALVTLAELIVRGVRASDIPCRFGGEEFVVTLPGATGEIAQRRAEALRVAFENTSFAPPAAPPAFATVSIGVATLVPGAESVASALARADAALYEAKRAGRNRVVVAAPAGA